MKISFVLPSIGRSGGIDVVYKYAYNFKNRGHDVIIYKELFVRNRHLYKSSVLNFIHQIYCSTKAFYEMIFHHNSIDKYVLKINDLFVEKSDIIIATAWPTAYSVNKLSDSKGKKIYFIQDFEIWDDKQNGLMSYKLPLDKIVISKWINDQLYENLKIGPYPIIYNGLDTYTYHITNDRNFTNKRLNFLMLNHTLPKKGVKYGLAAFKKVREKYPDARLTMFGFCDNKNLPDYVSYYQNPSKEKIIQLYNESDIFIFPSIEEGWGLTPLEAMACGCIVVGTKTGFVLDLGINEENMMISNPRDIDRMVYNIEKIIKDDILAKKIYQQQIETVKKLDWNKSSTRFLSLLQERQNER